MLIVTISVLEEKVEDFIAATRENAAQSREEPGVLRFELLRDRDDSRRFVLIEGYVDAEAQARHKETAHYEKWKLLAEPMMSEPRKRAIYELLDPA
jgi:quinol monooxygenase YgiN